MSNLTQWGSLMSAFGEFVVARYGVEETAEWYFEVWNEPDLHLLGPIKSFWTGTMSDYYDLYRVTALALKNVTGGKLKVGGPSTSDTTAYLEPFLNATRGQGIPVDFVSSHCYPSGRDRDTFATTVLAAADIATADANNPLGSAIPLPFVLSEFNSGLEVLMQCCHDTEYAAVFLMREVGALQAGRCTLSSSACTHDDDDDDDNDREEEVGNALAGISYWTFSDVFEEVISVEKRKAPFHNAYGLITMDGLKKPSFRALELLRRMPNETVRVTTIDNRWNSKCEEDDRDCVDDGTSDEEVEVYAGAPRPYYKDDDKTAIEQAPQEWLEMLVVIVNFVPAPSLRAKEWSVDIHISPPCPLVVSDEAATYAFMERIDSTHANAFREWKAVGSPATLDKSLLERLDNASALVPENITALEVSGEQVVLRNIDMPPTSSALVTLRFPCNK